MQSGRFAQGIRLVAWVAVGGLGLAVSQGCSGGREGDPNGRVVTGTVTYKGNPVESANVTFLSANGAAFGQTNAEGKFKLTTATGEKVSQGQYQVSIVKKESLPVAATPSSPDQYVPPDPNAPPAPAPKDLLPAKYSDVKTSGLTAAVTADGKNEFDFPLAD